FHAQLESEKALYPSRTEFFDNTCYHCHGVMGQRQVELDRNQPFKHSMVFALPDDTDGKYGALARDGVSCDACHRIAKEGLGTPDTFTGKFKLDPANAVTCREISRVVKLFPASPTLKIIIIPTLITAHPTRKSRCAYAINIHVTRWLV